MEFKWGSGMLWTTLLVSLMVAASVAAERGIRPEIAVGDAVEAEEVGLSDYMLNVVNFLWRPNESSYQHVWPSMKFGWQIIVGTIIGFLGSAFGSVGGVGGGGIYVPMLTLIIGFDAKSSTAISKCMIMGAAGSTVCYNLKLRHPTLDLPIIDYDLALLFQPMLMLGISIGVAFNVIFADWMVTVLLIILFIGTSTKAFLRGVDTWKKETISKKEAARKESNAGREEVEYESLPSGPGDASKALRTEVPIMENVCWKELGLLCFVWISFLILQVLKQYYTSTCSLWYWFLNFLQVPVSLGVSGYEAVSLYRGKRTISSKGEAESNYTVRHLVFYCLIGVLAGVVGGLLGLGGGFILGPVFLELGVPPQVSSATATFAMTFSSSMSGVEYYLLKRFPIPYASYFVAISLVAAFVGQHVVRRLIVIMGRASLIIFILAFTIFVSAISLGGVGISNMVYKIQHHDYMGFENLCKYEV
ncbi:sulfite exporter TauE/SafE family protein 3-like [Zingiber officinale]|uniref:sulfite exporter TauE/SafE family protein 3-like n=1 Tax=Zingiber officinale TaxID=94328 RepID=UPI001C4D2B9D|nr:sulfite exporter TauE/SafE family protein 3-like [Zingiber officinale]